MIQVFKIMKGIDKIDMKDPGWDKYTPKQIFKVKVISRSFLYISKTKSYKITELSALANHDEKMLFSSARMATSRGISMRRIHSRTNFQGQGHFKVINEGISKY